MDAVIIHHLFSEFFRDMIIKGEKNCFPLKGEERRMENRGCTWEGERGERCPRGEGNYLRKDGISAYELMLKRY